MLENILMWLGAGDQALTVMGPLLTVALAMFFGGSLTQLLKFPLARSVDGAWFDWTVRTVAFVSTAAFAHVLSDAITWPLEVGAGAAQPLAYKAGLAAVRRWAPWLEVSPLIGSVTPPASAIDAAEARRAERAAGD
jgi:hypothetical protein